MDVHSNDIKANEFYIRNLGDTYFFPPRELQDGLESVLIHTENTKKRSIPNGSAWQYRLGTPYNPAILRDDVGCGITGYIHSPFPLDMQSAKDITTILAEEDIHIGGGNHFINFMRTLPQHDQAQLALIHSDMNSSKYTPKSFDEALQRENDARELRREVMHTVFDRLGVLYEEYHDWTHNAVRKGPESITYRKGMIDLRESDNVGLLPVSPYDSVVLYAGLDSQEMIFQHGSGKLASKGTDHSKTPTVQKNHVITRMTRGMHVPDGLYEEFQHSQVFFDTFFHKKLTLGHVRPGLWVQAR